MLAEAEAVENKIIRVRDMPLGVCAKVIRIDGGHGITRKLLALGLRTGSSIEMVHRRGQGVVVASGGNRIALGATIAERIWVEVVD